MCFSGGTTTQTNTLPSWASSDIQNGLGSALNTYGTSTFQNYPGSLQATNDPSMAQAMGGTASGSSYVPGQVTAGSLSGSDLSGYTNPYTQSVIDSSMTNINRQLDQTKQSEDGQAAMSGAFGGDRAAIVNTEADRNANDLAAQTTSGLEQAGYTNAQQMATQDLNRNLSAQQTNVQSGLQGAGLRLGADQQLYSEGAGVTALNQAGINANNQQFREAQQYPLQMAQLQTGAIGQTSGALGDMLTRATTAPSTSTLGTIAGLGTTATGLLGLLGGTGSGSGSSTGLLGLGASGLSYLGNQLGLTGGTSAGSSLSSLNSGSLAGSPSSIPGLGTDTFFGTTGDTGSSVSDFSGSDGNILSSFGLGSFADGGLVDDPGYVPVAATDGMLTIDQSGNVLPDTMERAALARSNGAMMPLPSSSSATADGAGWSQPSTGSMGLLGYADGGQVIGVTPDGVPIYGPSGDEPVAAPIAMAQPQQGGLAGYQVNPVPPGGQIAMPSAQGIPGPAGYNTNLSPTNTRLPLASQDGYGDLDANLAAAGQAAMAPPDGGGGGIVGQPVSAAPVPAPDASASPPPAADPASAAPAPALAAPTDDTGTPDPSLPIPPIPPEGGAPVPTRLQASADPSAPLPGGQATPASSGSGLAAMPAGRGNGLVAQGMARGTPSSAIASGSGNSWAMPVLAAGLGMLSSAGPSAAKMIGGGLAGVQNLMEGRQMQAQQQLRLAQLQQTGAYQQGMLANRAGSNVIAQQRADTGTDRQQSQAQVNDARAQQLQASAQAALAKAQRAATPTTTTAQLKQNAIDDLVSQGVSPSDAYQQVSGLAIQQQRVDQQGNLGQQRIDQQGNLGQQRIDNQNTQFGQTQGLKVQQQADLQAQRQQQAQFHANDAENRGARAIMFAAGQAGKTVTYAAALQAVRSGNNNAGAAPIPAATPPVSGTAASSPPPSAVASKYHEGQIANGPNGKRAIFTNGVWQQIGNP